MITSLSRSQHDLQTRHFNGQFLHEPDIASCPGFSSLTCSNRKPPGNNCNRFLKALFVIQTTVSKHWRELKALIQTTHRQHAYWSIKLCSTI